MIIIINYYFVAHDINIIIYSSGTTLDPEVKKLANALKNLKSEEASKIIAVNKPKGLFEMIDMNTGGENPMNKK